MSIGNRIRSRRQALGLTQAQLAEVSNFTQSDISRWELRVNTPAAEAITPLADALGVSVRWLLTGEDEAAA